MDIITQYIDNNRTEQNMSFLIGEIVTQIVHLQHLATNANVEVIQTIRQITDIDTLEALRTRCIETKTALVNKRACALHMQNAEKIVNTYKKHNMGARQVEVNLLSTIRYMHFRCLSFSWYKFGFTMNNIKYEVEWCIKSNSIRDIKVDIYDEGNLWMIPLFTVNESVQQWDNVTLNKLAFMGKMSVNEYKTLICCLPRTIQKTYLIKIAFEYEAEIFAVSIANLLLCAMHEQYPKNMTFAKMTKTDLVFHDEYLLKCITSVECYHAEN